MEYPDNTKDLPGNSWDCGSLVSTYTENYSFPPQYFLYDYREKSKEATDNVNSPGHYKHNHKGIECITAIEASMSPEEFRGYLKGNIEKYLWRYPYKNKAEDLRKAQWYLTKLISVYTGEAVVKET